MTHDTLTHVESPQNPIRPDLTEAVRSEIAQIAQRQCKANGVLMMAINFVGAQVDDGLNLLPQSVRDQLDDLAKRALSQSYHMAQKSRQGIGERLASDMWHRIMAAMSGAVGGIGGLSTALAELPVATTVIFRAVQTVAIEHGEDPKSEETRMQCLAVFSAGGPGDTGDSIDTSFVGARISLSGTAVQGLINKVAPKFGAVLSQKLATQAVPVLGAVAGAGTNYAFVDYYVSMAHVHFSLRRLARRYGEDAVLDEFHRVLAMGSLAQT